MTKKWYANPVAQSIDVEPDVFQEHWYGPFPTRKSAAWILSDYRGPRLWSADIEGAITDPYTIARAVQGERMTAAYRSVPGDTVANVRRYL